MADSSALDAIIKFRSEFKPEKVIHVGDFIDTSAWRSGAKGTKDETADVSSDVRAGLLFLQRLEPTLVFNGNHEARLWVAAKKPNALLKHAAQTTIGTLEKFIKDELKADYVEDYIYEKSWRRLGNYLVGHGFKHSMHATKAHADHMGNSIFAHLHRQEVSRGMRSDRPTGVCIGYLGDRDKFTYADMWESRYRWQTGWCYGEYCDTETIWNLHRFIGQGDKAQQYLPA